MNNPGSCDLNCQHRYHVSIKNTFPLKFQVSCWYDDDWWQIFFWLICVYIITPQDTDALINNSFNSPDSDDSVSLTLTWQVLMLQMETSVIIIIGLSCAVLLLMLTGMIFHHCPSLLHSRSDNVINIKDCYSRRSTCTLTGKIKIFLRNFLVLTVEHQIFKKVLRMLMYLMKINRWRAFLRRVCQYSHQEPRSDLSHLRDSCPRPRVLQSLWLKNCKRDRDWEENSRDKRVWYMMWYQVLVKLKLFHNIWIIQHEN